jgi:hypothetical protein
MQQQITQKGNMLKGRANNPHHNILIFEGGFINLK